MSSREPSVTRRFSGKTYHLHFRAENKAQAERSASKWRKREILTRIVRTRDSKLPYLLYQFEGVRPRRRR